MAKQRAAQSGRKSVKRDYVVAELTRLIREGEIKPGDRFPFRKELEERFGVTTVTLQQAFDALKRDGFVITRGRWGTFVAEHPPCLYNIGLVYYTHPSETVPWSRFYRAIAEEATRLERAGPWRFPVYYDITAPDTSPACQALLDDIRRGRLSGLIFTNTPYPIADSPILHETDLPRVGVMSGLLASFAHIPGVYPDNRDFMERGLRRLRELGCTRVALLNPNYHDDERVELFRHWVGTLGMETAPEWVQGIAPGSPEWGVNTLQLLFSRHMQARPDGLIVSDDHLVPQVITGLLTAGVSVPDEVQVVAHANFPLQDTDMLPVLRCGSAAREVLETCLERLEQIRDGAARPELTSVPALFEDEWRDRYRTAPEYRRVAQG